MEGGNGREPKDERGAYFFSSTLSFPPNTGTAIDVDRFYYSSEDDRDRPPTPPRVEPAIVAAAPRQTPQAAK